VLFKFKLVMEFVARVAEDGCCGAAYFWADAVASE
jgi:hypothetical protein